MEDCLFCKIIKGGVSSAKVYEDENHLAFLDIFPANKGHTLIIPKKHYAHFSEIPHEEIGRLIEAVRKVAAGVKTALKAEGINLFLNEGRAAGQLIFHAHFHVIPRFEGDGLIFKTNREKYSDETEKEQFRNKIASALKK